MLKSEVAEYIQEKGLYILQKKDVERAIHVSVDAYYKTYPLYDLLLGDNYSKEYLMRMWDFNMRLFFDNSLVFADSPEINAFAIWVAPDAPHTGLLYFLSHYALRSLTSMGISASLRLARYDSWSERMRLSASNGNSWYLFSIQCLKEMQGKHLGTKLMAPMLEYLRQTNRQMYLETHKPENVALYEHFGLKVAYQSIVPGTDIPFYSMTNDLGRQSFNARKP